MAGRDPLKNSYPKDLVSYLDLMDISVNLESICWPILQSEVESYSTEKALNYCSLFEMRNRCRLTWVLHATCALLQ